MFPENQNQCFVFVLPNGWVGATPGSCFSYSFACDCTSVWPQCCIWYIGTISTINREEQKQHPATCKAKKKTVENQFNA